jgi:hypothetical protein
MRWKEKIKVYPKNRDKRIISRFLILPMCLDGEWRWLEKIKIEQVYTNLIFGSMTHWKCRHWAE